MVWSAILGIVAVILIFQAPQPIEGLSPILLAIVVFGVFAGIPAGWKVLSFRRKPKKKFKDAVNDAETRPYVWFILPFIFLYYILLFFGIIIFLKFTIAFCIGIFVLPFRLYRNIKRLKELKRQEISFLNGD